MTLSFETLREEDVVKPGKEAPRRRHRSLAPLLLLPALILFLGVFIIPLGGVFLESFGGRELTFKYYFEIFRDPVLVDVLISTLLLSLAVTAICVLLGYPVALLMLRSAGWLQRLIALLIILPLWTSLLVRTYSWMVILGRKGLVNETLLSLGLIDSPFSLLYNRFSVYVGMVHIMLPFMVLPLFAVMRRIDMNLMSAASSLGASKTRTFFAVFLPLSLPGVMAGSLLVFILSIGFFVTPALLGGLGDTTFVMLIERQVNRLFNWPLASAMSVSLLAATLVLVILYNRIISSTNSKLLGRIWVRVISFLGLIGGPVRSSNQTGLIGRLSNSDPGRPPREFPAISIVAWVVLAITIFPILILYPLAFSDAPYLRFPPPDYSTRWFENYLSRADWLRPTFISFQVAVVVMVLGTGIGTAAAVALVRGDFPFKKATLGLLLSPIIVPTIISAVALYYLFASYGLVGTRTGLVLAHLTLAVPFVIVVVSSSLERVDPALERAAWTLGATKFVTFRKITLPLIKPAVITASLFAFLASFDEVVMAIFLSGVQVKTLPKRMWEGIREEIDPTTAAVAAILVTLSLFAILIVQLLRRSGQAKGAAVHDELTN
ncbi:ABC transporter permease subunit [Limibacillus sp. MBR-115]|jgi:putative spermidine/putrescine transport system permease protein|uniref:ABC transporter permease subunit n=1 Tax=Limibacillus sp. MBR-115 TaxID=3156465 RepID=UPI0033920B77